MSREKNQRTSIGKRLRPLAWVKVRLMAPNDR